MGRNRLNYFCAVGVAVLFCLLVVMYMHERKQRAVKAEENRQIAARVEAEQGQHKAAIAEIYGSLTEALAKGPAGFVCWGDKEMEGNQYGTLPSSLDHKIDETFFSSLRQALIQSGAYDARGLGIQVVNMAASNEGLNEIMVRTGAHQMVLGQELGLLSGNDKNSMVNVTLADEEGNVLHFADQKYAKFGTTTIDDVEGSLYTGTESYDDLHSMLAFRRKTAGEEYVIPAGEEVETQGAEVYRKYYPVLFFSEQEGVSASKFVSCMQEITDRYRRRNRNVVICVTAQGSEWDLALQEAFGDHYLRQDKHVEEMTAEDYDALADRVFAAFEAQGTFNRVDKATQEAFEGLDGLRQGNMQQGNMQQENLQQTQP